MSKRFNNDQSFKDQAASVRSIYMDVERYRQPIDTQVFDKRQQFGEPWMQSDHE